MAKEKETKKKKGGLKPLLFLAILIALLAYAKKTGFWEKKPWENVPFLPESVKEDMNKTRTAQAEEIYEFPVVSEGSQNLQAILDCADYFMAQGDTETAMAVMEIYMNNLESSEKGDIDKLTEDFDEYSAEARLMKEFAKKLSGGN